MNTTVKLLVPLSTLAVAAAVVVGSGATWTSTTDSTITATAGTLVQTNTKNNATLAVTNLEPGSSQEGTLTIANTGSLDGVLTLTGSSTDDLFLADAVTLTIAADPDGAGSATAVVIYSGDFDGIDDAATGIQTWAGGPMATGTTAVFTFTVEMDPDATHENQGQSADANISFVMTQDETDDESGIAWTGTPIDAAAETGDPGTE